MIDKVYIKAKNILGESETFVDHYLVMEGGKISAITPNIEDGVECLDYSNATLVPGLIDLHIHGREGCDVMDATHTALATISTSLAEHGVTGFLATTVTSTWDDTLAAMDAIGNATNTNMPGAKVLGGYSEGLFFTEDHKGAHDEQYFLALTKDRIDAMFKACHGQLKVLALAPEINNACEMIEYMNGVGIQSMLGHTNATYDETRAALTAGASGGVHVFNGMRGIHHREPGCTGAVLMEDTQVEVIADGVHLHPAILEMICALKTPDKVTLISDCIQAGGKPDGTYKLGQLDVHVKDGIAKTDSGSLAGSTLTLETAVQNLVKLAGVEFRDAIHMASLTPATFLGIEDQTGSIKLGKNADIAVLNENGQVDATFIDGDLIFNR